MTRLYARFCSWWLPFWYGDPCRHGVYGHCYNSRDVIECRDCMREIDAAVREAIAADREAEIRALFGPVFAELDRRVRALEAKRGDSQ